MNNGFDELGLFKVAEERKEQLEFVVENTYKYVVKRKHWFKAFEVVTQLACWAHEYIEKKAHEKALFTLYLKKFNVSELNDDQKELLQNEIDNFKVSAEELKIFKY